MLTTAIFVVLLIANWFITETFVFVPVNLLNRIVSIGWWGLALLAIAFVAWCIGDD